MHKIVNTKKMSIHARVLKRRKEVAHLLLDGNTYQEMGDKLGVTKKLIHDDVHIIFADWRQTCLKDIDKSILVELDRLKYVLAEAQEHWELSKKASRVKRTKRTVPDGDNGEKKFEMTVETMKLQPDKNYLELIVKTSERLCKMLGLDEVQEIKLSGKVERSEEYKLIIETRDNLSIEKRRDLMRVLEPPKGNGSE